MRMRPLGVSALLGLVACGHKAPAPTASPATPEVTPTPGSDDLAEGHVLETLFGEDAAIDCEQVVEQDLAVRAFILKSGSALSVRFPAPSSPPLVLASPATTYGVYLFRKEGAGYRMHSLAVGSSIKAIKLSGDGKTLYVVSMWSREGPGDYRVAKLHAESERIECATLARPEFGRSLDYADFAALFVADDGRGNLLTKTALETDSGQTVKWFRYDTADAAKSWSAPMPLADAPAAIRDLPAAPVEAVPSTLLEELLRPTAP